MCAGFNEAVKKSGRVGHHSQSGTAHNAVWKRGLKLVQGDTPIPLFFGCFKRPNFLT